MKNRKRGMETWNILTAIKKRRERGTRWKKVKGLGKEYISITHRYRQKCGDGQIEGRGGGWVEACKVGEMRTSIIVSTIKVFF